MWSCWGFCLYFCLICYVRLVLLLVRLLMSFVLRQLSPRKQPLLALFPFTWSMSGLIICCCVYLLFCVCVFVCPLEYPFLWENTKWYPSHYFIPSNCAALLWHVGVCQMAQSDIWCHNRKPSIAIDYQSTQQQPFGYVDTFPGLENLLCELLQWIIHNTSWGHRSTKNKSATESTAFSWSSSDWLWWLWISGAQMAQETKSQLLRSPPLFHTRVWGRS